MRPARTVAAPLALIAALALAGCGSSSGDADAKAPASSPTKAVDEHHKINVTWDDPVARTDKGYVGAIAAQENTSPQAFTKYILEQGGIEGIADGFSQSFVLPIDLTVHVSNQAGSPFYDPSTKTVNIFYDFATLTADIIKQSQSPISDDELGKQWAAVNDFILVHELAHAFIDVLKNSDGGPGIPVTGREEDTADGMATFLFTDFVEHGPEYAFDAAAFFAALQDFQGSPDATQFADEHSLSIQRAGDIACKVAGSSEENMTAIQQLGVLPDTRLARCPGEYQQLSSTWRTLLKPFARAS